MDHTIKVRLLTLWRSSTESERLIYLVSLWSLACWVLGALLDAMGWTSRPLIYSLGVYPAGVFMLRQPWGLFTYALTHSSLFHLINNMLLLHLVGRLLEQHHRGQAVMPLFAMGAFSGAGLYSFVYQICLVLGIYMPSLPLLGASAGISALAVGLIVLYPQLRVNLLLFGQVRILWLILGLFALGFLLGGSGNWGGTIAHLGGGLLGFSWVYLQRRSGIDIAEALVQWLQHLKGRLQPKQAPPAQGINEVLDKIRHGGYGSLSEEERQRLFDWSNKLNQNKKPTP